MFLSSVTLFLPFASLLVCSLFSILYSLLSTLYSLPVYLQVFSSSLHLVYFSLLFSTRLSCYYHCLLLLPESKLNCTAIFLSAYNEIGFLKRNKEVSNFKSLWLLSLYSSIFSISPLMVSLYMERILIQEERAKEQRSKERERERREKMKQ